MSDRDPLRDLWAGQQTGEFSMPLEEIRRKARGFQKTIRWRNIREYAASALVIGIFGWMAVIIPEPVVKAGCILTVLGALYVCWKLHTMARAANADEMNAAESLADFHRKELLRQRAALASVWRWYLLPFVPGALVFVLGVSLSPDNPAPFMAKLGVLAFAVAIEAAVFVAVWWLNAQAAKALDKEIAALEDEI